MQNYSELIEICQKALADLPSTEELLEYPEIQADKAVFLVILEQYRKLKLLSEKVKKLEDLVLQQDEATKLLKECTDAQKDDLYCEISQLMANSAVLAGQIAQELGNGGVQERVFCRIRATRASAAKIADQLFTLLCENLQKDGAKVKDILSESLKSEGLQISFHAEGFGVMSKLGLFRGCHKVFTGDGSQQFTLSVTPDEQVTVVSEKDLKIDLFHSSGAGGQNVNKVETAVRVTHIPTGTVVVCQDERSQLKNKNRAIVTLTKRLQTSFKQEEKRRMEADLKEQEKASSKISFRTDEGVMTDERLNIPTFKFPPKSIEFQNYLNTILAKGL